MSNTQSFDTSVSSNSKPEVFIKTKIKIYGDPKALTIPFNVLVKANLYEGEIYRSCRHAAGTVDSFDSICELEDKAISRLISSIGSSYTVTVLRNETVVPKDETLDKLASSKKGSSSNKSTKAVSIPKKQLPGVSEIIEPEKKGEVFSGQIISGDLFHIPHSESPDESLKATFQDILQNKGLSENDFPEVDFSNRKQVKTFIASQVD